MSIHNTPEYRKDKRIVAFVDKEIKKAILKKAKKDNVSVSKLVGDVLVKAFFRNV